MKRYIKAFKGIYIKGFTLKQVWLKILIITLLTGYINANLYEDAEDGLTRGWRIYDNSPSGAKIKNIYDHEKNNRVISFIGNGYKNGYILGGFNKSRNAWKNSNEKVMQWSMKYSEEYYFYISINTKQGDRFLLYSSSNKDSGKKGKYICYGLGSNTINGKWNHITRDIESDLKRFEPNNQIIAINGFLVRGSGKIDDISLVSKGKVSVEQDDEIVENIDIKERGTFKHPGVLVTRGQLDFIRKKVLDGASPWKEAFERMKESPLAKKRYRANPKRVIPYGKNHKDTKLMEIEDKDARAAYTQALMWYITKDAIYAKNSIKILNAWTRKIKKHTGSSKGLVSAWSSVKFVRAAEIIRYTYSGWRSSDIRRFEKMLRDVYLVNTIDGSKSAYQNGNWELLMSDATISMGIFLNDKEVFKKGLELWRRRVPAYIYLKSDGKKPILVPESQALQNSNPNWGIEGYLWFNHNRSNRLSKRYANGMSQETCRDFGHVALGFAGMINAAETAYIQGVDLYKEEKRRIIAGAEFHTKYLNLNYNGRNRGYRETNIENWLCRNNIRSGNNYVVIGSTSDKTYEVVYNHYVNRMGISLPNTHDYIYSKRPATQRGVSVWETLTHGEVGNRGR
jgi:hypothetical protein